MPQLWTCIRGSFKTHVGKNEGVGAGQKMAINVYVYGEKCKREGRYVGGQKEDKIMST